MCGRFEQHLPAVRDWVHTLADWPSNAERRHNICPTQDAGTIDAQGYSVRHWSLIPSWANEPKLKYSTFNARAETLAEKSTFRNAWKQSQRCLVPASGYFEWTGVKGSKQCHYVKGSDDSGLCFGGLWETWRRDDQRVSSFTIVTVAADPSIEWLHHRMPLMLGHDEIDAWLAGSPEEASALLSQRVEPRVTVQAIESPTAIHRD